MKTEDLAILIPTLGRAHRIPKLVDQIHENTSASHHVYLIIEEDDHESIHAAAYTTSTQMLGRYRSCANAYNAGFNFSIEPFVFLANDDLEFPPMWEAAAIAMIKRGYPIVGVDDGHGKHTAFSMVDSAWIRKHSGVYDKPGTLCHPYTSQFVDTELAEYAMARGVWATATPGVIHKHPAYGESDEPDHPNYRKAQATWAEDEAIYNERKPKWEAAANAA